MEVPNKRSLHIDSQLPVKVAKWRWRTLYFTIWLLAAFLVISIFGLGVLALVAGIEEELEGGARMLALGAGGAILVVGLAILKSIFPRESIAPLFQKKN
ncbi:hypothetical protein [Pseudomonas vancouverensis]|uniref:Uncharacterized protein n=1 Tax=Pseudomonas vancouverensis TaxID=95300 RepID=A0A1H2MT74_PSEVA|nr:hypothetical protein [Pseudomonas vancouverensis]KAB0489769.1 hypothetical protein F7R09_29070 [Pseudomonas vancouverensis]TDB67264.1 hypothetical protein EIY72_04240 [Pseudomonas vancouverensis]SDU96294.1 hypothetical protein SAMN05216558_1222 [Pseudomonas vancouverensis]